jgi:iron complex outermembrane receptor protein
MVNNKSIALTPIAAAVSAALAPGAVVHAQEKGSSAIEEIVVTSRKREENLQDIPASIQAIPQETLEKMGVNGIEDYARFIPSVNVVSYQPGSSEIVFRGINSGGLDTGQAPASLYFDELPLTTTGNQPEVRMIDINRVEALAGPQGSLFGGSAQAGTLRVITNQPDPDQFEVIGEVTVKQGENTSMSHEVSGVLNMPLAEGKAALRIVGFTATDAGFIDNVFGHTPDAHAWYDIPDTWGNLDNAAVVEDDYNGVDFVGGRIAFAYDFNDAWGLTLVFNYKKTEATGNGGNHYDPNVGDLEVVKFNKGSRDQEWDAWNLTIDGDLGWAQLVSSSSYYQSDSQVTEDATVYIKYYQAWACLGEAAYYPRYCFGNDREDDVLQLQHLTLHQGKFAQEFRLSGGNDNMDWIVGLFYETTDDDWDSPWGDPTNYDYQDSFALAYWQSYYGEDFGTEANWGWHSVSRVEWEQTAVFGEMTYDFSDQWSVTAGGRWFDRNMLSEYIVYNPQTEVTSADFIANGGPTVTEGGSSDFVPKISAAFSPTDDKMLYALYSEGFRPGGTNRGRGNPSLPVIFEADKLENFELGAKTRWADGRVQVNLTYYNMTWKDYQLQVLDPSYADGEPWQQVIANAGDAEAIGWQLEFDWVINDNLNFGFNAVTQDSKTTTDVSTDTNPETIEIPSGTRLPLAVEKKGSAWLDVHWETNFIPGSMFARLQYSYTGDSVNQIAPASSSANPQRTNAAYSIADFRIGLATDSEWQVDLFISNLFDERAELNQGGYFEGPFMSLQDGRTSHGRTWTNRPREYGIRIAKRWGD